MKAYVRLLKAVALIIGLCAISILIWVLPMIGQMFLEMAPELSYYYQPWLIFLRLIALPWFVVLFLAYQVFDAIGKDEAFTMDNARRFKRMWQIGLADVIVFFVVNVIYIFKGIHHPGIFILALGVVLIGIVFVICTAALSELVERAAILQDQYDLTI